MRKVILAAVLLASAALAAEPALAHGGRGRVQFGIQIGAPFYGPPFPFPYAYHPFHPFHPFGPYYYPHYPPAIYVAPAPQQPQVWIERERSEPALPVPGFWYYCPDSRAYYPSVGACPGGWQRVPPQPPHD